MPERPKNRPRPEDRVPVVARKRGNARGAKGHRNGRSVSKRDSEGKSAVVPERVKQAEEIRGRWPWVERSVWSERMLQALENRVKGGKWFSLIDHQRWPNAYFDRLGFYSLVKARALVLQSR